MDPKEVKTELGEELKTPAGKEVSQDDQDFIKLALKRVKKWEDKNSKAIDAAKSTHRFVVKGEHWPADDRAKREADKLFCIEHNYGIVHRDGVAGEIIQNMPMGKYIGFDGSVEDKKLGDIETSLLRRIEANSQSDIINRDTVKQCLVSGYPAWQEIIHDYPSHESFNQEIFIRYIHSQFSVMLDPDMQAFDTPGRGGPKWGMVIEDMTRAEYKRAYPGAQIIAFNDSTAEEEGWWTADNVRVASYYNAEPKKATMVLLSLAGKPMSYGVEKDGKEHKKALELAAEMSKTSSTPVEVTVLKERKDVIIYEIKHYVINSREILVGPEEVLFNYIPLVPFEGKYDWDSDGRKLYRGVFDNAKYANLMLDLWSTKAAELVITGRQHKATAKQIGGHAADWNNQIGQKILYYDVDPQLGPGASPIELNTTTEMDQSVKMMVMAGDMIKDLTNRHESSIGEQGNEKSGRAINARAQQGQNSNYEFPANIAASVDYRTRIIESGIPKVYDYEMMVRIIGDDGRSKRTEAVNQSIPTSDGQGHLIAQYKNDITQSRFDTQVSIGPSFKNKAQETAQYLSDIGRSNPEMAILLGDLSLMAMDFQYADEAANRVKAYINLKMPGVMEAASGDEGAQEKSKIKQAVDQAVGQLKQQLMPGMQQLEQNDIKKNEMLQKAQATIQEMELKLQSAKMLMDDKTRDYQLESRKLDIEQQKVNNALVTPIDHTPQLQALEKKLEDLASITATVMEQHREAIVKNMPSANEITETQGGTE